MRNFIVNFEKCKILNGVKFLIYVCTFIKIEKKKISTFGTCRSLVFCSCVIKMPRCMKILDINFIKKKIWLSDYKASFTTATLPRISGFCTLFLSPSVHFMPTGYDSTQKNVSCFIYIS